MASTISFIHLHSLPLGYSFFLSLSYDQGFGRMPTGAGDDNVYGWPISSLYPQCLCSCSLAHVHVLVHV